MNEYLVNQTLKKYKYTKAVDSFKRIKEFIYKTNKSHSNSAYSLLYDNLNAIREFRIEKSAHNYKSCVLHANYKPINIAILIHDNNNKK